MVQSFAGVDVGQRSLALVIDDARGRRVLAVKLGVHAEGRAAMLQALQSASALAPRDMHVAVEDPHGVVASTLQQRRYDVRVVRPLAVSRARQAATTAGAKDDLLDAALLAQLVRTQPRQHVPLARNSDAALVLFCATRSLREQQRITRALNNQLHAHLAGYYPAAVRTFPSWDTLVARTTLSLAASPEEAKHLHSKTLQRALSEAGSTYASVPRARGIITNLRERDMRLTPQVEAENAERTRQLLEQIQFEEGVRDAQARRVLDLYAAHPWHDVFSSFPALKGVVGARILAELGDDLDRFHSARGWQALAGVRPVTKASGQSSWDHRRYIHNRVLGSAVFMWMLPLTQASPAARSYYQYRKGLGDRHGTATRKLASAYLGILWSCVHTGRPYDEERAMQRFNRTLGGVKEDAPSLTPS